MFIFVIGIPSSALAFFSATASAGLRQRSSILIFSREVFSTSSKMNLATGMVKAEACTMRVVRATAKSDSANKFCTVYIVAIKQSAL